MPVVEALRNSAQVVLPEAAPLGGALVEETSLLCRWLARPGVRIVNATDGFASPLHSAGAWSAWAATARSARYAAADLIRNREADPSELLGESHPALKQATCGTGVDGLGGTGQTVLPRRQPFGMAG